MIDVVCLKWGDLYGPEYVNRLKRAVTRHLSVEHQFHCITDDTYGLDDDINTMDMPEQQRYPKWWGKLLAFSGVFQNKTIVLDLDTVILDNIDFLAEYDEFAALEGFGMPFRLGSAVMVIPQGYGRAILDNYEIDPNYAQMYCGQWGDGHWIQLNVGSFHRLQKEHPGKFVSYKWHCRDGVPEGAAMVCFHGSPRPHEVETPWMKEYWHGDEAKEDRGPEARLDAGAAA